MTDRKKAISIFAIVSLCCVLMALVDLFAAPNYAVKSLLKLIILLILPVGYAVIGKNADLKSLFVFRKKSILISLALGLAVFCLIVGGYFLVSPYFDFSKVTDALVSGVGVSAENFVFVALYISFVNSLLEEFFFRGFAFLTLKKVTSVKVATVFSAFAFALYHIAIMVSWFDLLLFILLIAALVVAGLFFNRLDQKSGTIYPSWFVHMFANFAINTVGFILFGLL